jgi:hypothetical protein
MSERRPLVLVDGQPRELPHGDTLPASFVYDEFEYGDPLSPRFTPAGEVLRFLNGLAVARAFDVDTARVPGDIVTLAYLTYSVLFLWLLESEVWDDTGVWDDSATWLEAAAWVFVSYLWDDAGLWSDSSTWQDQ